LLTVCLLSINAARALDPNTSDKSKLAANSPAAAKPAAAAKAQTPEPEATPAPKKRGLIGRVFGKKSAPEATPPAATPATPAPQATPAPKVSRKTRSADAAKETSTAKSKKPDTEKAVSEKAPTAAEKPAPEKAAESPAVTSKGKKGAKTPVAAVKKPENQPPDTTDPEVLEKWKLGEAKTKALEDPELRAIKSKADAAATDEESRKTLRIYNKALFSKIRQIDPSIKERADRMEVAILKQLADSE
jgi:hypothetical protein